MTRDKEEYLLYEGEGEEVWLGEVLKDAVVEAAVGCWPRCSPPRSGLSDPPDFFHGWNPFPTAASARGGGDMLLSLLHWAASIARGFPRSPA